MLREQGVQAGCESGDMDLTVGHSCNLKYIQTALVIGTEGFNQKANKKTKNLKCEPLSVSKLKASREKEEIVSKSGMDRDRSPLNPR